MINGRVYDVLDIVKRLQPVNRHRVAEELGIKPGTASEYLAELRARGMAWTVGRGPSAAWVGAEPTKAERDRRLSPKQVDVLESIKRSQPVARRQLAEMLDMNKRTLSVHLDILRQRGFAEPTGLGSGARWIAIKPRDQRPAASDVFSLAQSMGLA